MDAPAVFLQDLTKRFGDFPALREVTLEIPRQTLFGLLGPNGAGKTTLFSLVAGFLRPTKGAVQVLGVDISRVAELQGRLSILPQDAQFQANVPILDQMVFFSRLSGRSREEADREARAALEMVGLGDSMKRSARVLSHGMAKRLGIAQAFLGRPEVILLDEPTSGLDPANARKMRDLIRDLKGKATLVISSHDLREIQEMCSHVAILDKGKLVATGTVDEITRSSRQLALLLSRELSAEEVAEISRLPSVQGVLRKDFAEYAITLDLSRSSQSQDEAVGSLLHALIEKGAVPRRLSEGVSLESFFLRVTGEESQPLAR